LKKKLYPCVDCGARRNERSRLVCGMCLGNRAQMRLLMERLGKEAIERGQKERRNAREREVRKARKLGVYMPRKRRTCVRCGGTGHWANSLECPAISFEDVQTMIGDLAVVVEDSKAEAERKKKIERQERERKAALARSDERARAKHARPRAVSKAVATLVRGPFKARRVAIMWRYGEIAQEALAPYGPQLRSPIVERAVAAFAEARLSDADLRTYGHGSAIVDFELARGSSEPKWPLGKRIVVAGEIVQVIDVLARKHEQLSRSMIITSAVRELSRVEHPPVEENAEDKAERIWEENERQLARTYRGVEPEDMAREAAEAELQLAKKKSVPALERTESGPKIAALLGLEASGCAGLTVIDDPESEGGKGIGACESEVTPHFCPQCRQRFCDACFSVSEKNREGECPTCDET